MPITRLISIFWRGDGSVLFDEKWGSGRLPYVLRPQERSGQEAAFPPSVNPGSMNNSDGSEAVSGRTIWSLVQVFIQFAREVDGGSVQRLIFRDPVHPVGNRQAFGSSPSGVSLRQPVLIHVANDGLFVVTVTEALSAEVSPLRRADDDFPAKQFVQEVLLHVAQRQASFTNGTTTQTVQSTPASARRTAASSRANLPGSRVGGDSLATARADVQRSYISDTSDSSFASHPSASLSENSFTSSEGDRGSSDDAPSAPMMPIDTTLLRAEIHRIANSLLSTSLW